MLRAICASAALLACAPALAQDYSGTYITRSPQGGTVTLTLKQDASRNITGTLSGNNTRFKVDAEAMAEGVVGTLTSGANIVYLLAELDGSTLNVLLAEPGADGQPNMQAARQLAMTRTSAAAKPQAKAQPRREGKPAGDPLSQLLTSTAWCGFTYNQRSGTSTRERVVFGADGSVVQRTGADTYSSGRYGSVAGQHSGGNQGRWKVQDGVLHLSQDGFNWAPQPVQVTRNSNGYPILKSGGKEYMQCN